MNAVTRLDIALREAGIPIQGVSEGVSGYVVHFDNATDQQVLQANEIILNFDGRGTRARNLQDIADAIEALTVAQQRKVFCYAVAYLAITDPRVGERLKSAFSIDPEEPDGP